MKNNYNKDETDQCSTAKFGDKYNFIWQFSKWYGGVIDLELHSYIVLNWKMLCVNEGNNTSKVLKGFKNINIFYKYYEVKEFENKNPLKEN